MKTFATSVLATAALSLAATANAAVIDFKIQDIATNPNAGTDFENSLYSITAQESFDGMGDALVANYVGNDQETWENKSSSFTTSVGTFELITPGQGGSNVYSDELMIESTRTGEHGRDQGIASDTDFWLDSNDAEKVTWTFGSPLGGYFNAFGFYLYDASDISANLKLIFDNSESVQITFPEANGNVHYVSLVSDMNILDAQLVFDNSTSNDGWGINNATVGTVSEPGTLLLMGLGLLGLGAARKRVAKH